MSDTALSEPGAPTSNHNRNVFIRLAAVIAGGVAIATVTHALAVLVVILALIAMVMLHEFGHFTMAKLSGMQVTEYFLGFGPRLWSVRRGETEYGVKALPLGGFVRITGMTMLEEVDPAVEGGSYRQATFPWRIAVAVAGSAMHFIIVFGLLWGIAAFTGLPASSQQTVSGVATFVGGQSPAKAGGVHVGDVLVSVNGHTNVVNYIEAHPGKRLSLVVRRHGRLDTLHVVPVDGRKVTVVSSGKRTTLVTGSSDVGRIGVELASAPYVTVNPLAAIPKAGSLLGSYTAETGVGIANVFSFHGLSSFAHSVAVAGHHNATTSTASGTQNQNSDQVLSIYGAARLASQAAGRDVSQLLVILVAINLFVGMINLFPMLPLDGGHVVIAVYERLRSRRGRAYHADVTKLMPVAYVFLVFILVLGIGVLYANIVQPPSLPG